MGRDRYPRQSLGSLHTQIKQARVLLIGAGGIGCELLKNLVMTGFGEIHVVDLDTIDLSNLNRQFLFRREHIKKPKATVAIEVASKFNPSCQLTAHYANIKDVQSFPTAFFRSFTLVFNALDNLDARRHVNKMCLVADVPLIESGTTGFNGQVQAIKKGKTACYDCTEKVAPKTYPVCTIRSTPSQPIHCIVWAKSYLFPELFGKGEDDDDDPDVLDQREDSDNVEEIQSLRAEAQALKRIRDSMNDSTFPQQVFEKVFNQDIERLLGMKDMWKNRRPPTSLHFSTLQSEASSTSSTVSATDQNPWTLLENFSVFVSSLQRLVTRLQQNLVAANAAAEVTDPSKTTPIITFDKEDPDTLDFVTSAANLRSEIFSIPLQSKFTVKQMAGNIIPAIATTNAMAAGLCVMQAFKVLRGDHLRAKMLFLETSGVRAINSEAPRPPNSECAVCSVAMGSVEIDPERATLSDLVDGVLKSELGYGEELTLMNEVGPIYDPDMEDMLSKKFAEVGVNDESFLTVVDDEEENPRVNLQLAVASRKIDEAERPVLLVAPENDETTASTPVDESDRERGGRAAKFKIARKPKKPRPKEIRAENGDSVAPTGNVKATPKIKRTAEVAGLEDPDALKQQAAAGDLEANVSQTIFVPDKGGAGSDKNRNGEANGVNDGHHHHDSAVGLDPAQVILLDDGDRTAGGSGGGLDDGPILIEDD